MASASLRENITSPLDLGPWGRFLRPSPAPSLVSLLQSFLSLDSTELESQHSVKNKKWLWDKEEGKEGGGRVHKKKDALFKIFAMLLV